MSNTPPAPRLVRPPSQAPGKRMSLSAIATKGNQLPPRMIVHGVGGIGKTSFAAYAPKPVFLMSKLETGAVSLMDAGLIPDGQIGCLPECQTWDDTLAGVEALTQEPHDFKTVVADVANGFERLCFDFVTGRDYKGSAAQFNAYKAGPEVAVNDWRAFLGALDRLRETRKMLVILLAHTKVKNFRNPEGPDYDRFVPDMSEQGWAATYAWADVVLFANYATQVLDERGKRGKGQGGEERFLYTERCAAYDAKNRYGLPELIAMGTDGRAAWTNFKTAYDQAKAAGTLGQRQPFSGPPSQAG